MEKGKPDRRVRYTKALLRDALIVLMKTQHISAVSVKQLCDLADVNRSTFYAHYTDPYDLLSKIEREAMADLKGYLEKQDYQDNRPISAQVLTRILEYVRENADLFKALISENCDFAFQKDIMDLAQVVTSRVSSPFEPRMQEYLQEFEIAGCISTVKKWLQDGMPEPPEKISEFILQIAYFGVFNGHRAEP